MSLLQESAARRDPREAPPSRLRTIATRSLALVGLTLAFVPSVALLIWPDITDPLGDFAYAGVFLVNLVSTATLFIPVPGVTATANVIIVTEASDSSFPWLVGVLGGAGMAIGEFTAYFAGVFGAHTARTQNLELPPRIAPLARRLFEIASKLMHRWGMLTLFVLAAVPDPFFEFAAVTAGSLRMPVHRYFFAVFSGCIVRGLTLAYLGQALPFLT